MKKIILFVLLFSTPFILQAQDNIISNPEFDSGKTSWLMKKINPAAYTSAVNSDGLLSGANYLAVTITNGGSAEGDIIVFQSRPFEQGRIYQFSFMASASMEHTIHAMFMESTGDYTVIWSSPELDLTTTPQTFGPYTLNYYGADQNYRVQFNLGGLTGVTVNLDAIVLTETDDPGHIRIEEKFLYRSHTFTETTLPYRLCIPDGYDPNQSYPLVLALHGSGECGSDNELPISVHRLATSWADSANQKNYPCFVVVPQCPTDGAWNDYDFNDRDAYRIFEVPISNEMTCVMDMLDSLIREFPVDENRLYITGLSLGGYGTWDAIQRFPNKFACAIPMSGGGDSTQVQRIKHIPIWNFHGEVDNTVPVTESRKMIEALERQGLDCVYTHCNYGDCTGMSDAEVQAVTESGARLLYTEWANKSHVMWAESYDYPYLFPWVFAQNKLNNPDPVRIDDQAAAKVGSIQLRQNYPNPFNPVTTIEFSLSKPQEVKIELFNIQGQKVRDLFKGKKGAGLNQVTLNAANLASGTYIYRITAGDYVANKMMTLQK